MLGSIKSGINLTAEECLEIGLRALSLKQYDFALEWLHLSKTKHLHEEDNSEVDMNFLEQTLKYAIKEVCNFNYHSNFLSLKYIQFVCVYIFFN